MFLTALLVALALPASAQTTATRVAERDRFVALTNGKALTRFAIRLEVAPNGTIGGRAFGRDVTGQWTWEDGFFCRAMEAGSTVLERNCQAVYLMDDALRFVADRGQGDTADLAIR
ncbi:dihydrodipicolinate reductase [Anianabacter salinae]|uniref:dihydrodipicolinate reductase n=1 Tax=Anianabacter salinae TaxID=2851023 RepID=UPI00225E0558|nr:dihydrodipicolinate reductase [Anianabacter salinae]